jgi:DNA-binding response OmpR family regulator
MKVLVVEDEPLLASTLAIGLRAEGCVVVEASNGVDGLWHAVEHDGVELVLDRMPQAVDAVGRLDHNATLGAEADGQGRGEQWLVFDY